MKKLILILTLLFSINLSYAGDSWYDLESGMSISTDEGKPVVIDFFTDWCKWCKVMDKKTFQDPEVKKYLFEYFAPIRIDAESNDNVEFKGQSYTYRSLTRAFGVNSYPSLAYLDKDGEVITIIPGYIEKEQFLLILEYIAKECYKNDIPFEEFKKHSDCKD